MSDEHEEERFDYSEEEAAEFMEVYAQREAWRPAVGDAVEYQDQQPPYVDWLTAYVVAMRDQADYPLPEFDLWPLGSRAVVVVSHDYVRPAGGWPPKMTLPEDRT